VRGPAAPKIAALERLIAAGVPVPAFVALADTAEPDTTAWLAIDAILLRGGPVIVRAALAGEDTADASGAGLGTSIAGCRDRDEVRAALRQIAATLHDPWLADYFSGPPRAQVLVQREIAGPWLAVVAQALLHLDEHDRPPPPASPAPFVPDAQPAAPARVCHVELHRRDHSEPLAAGLSPALAGPLELFPADLREPIAHLCERVTAALPAATHGLDLELVADHEGRIWVVQARPLTRPLHPGWPAFAAAARLDLPASDLRDRLPLPGLWVLDAEHNPTPLSPAHAGLIRRLTAEGGARMQVLAGWLYIPGKLAAPTPSSTTASLRAALTALQERHIPDARAELARIDRLLDFTPLTTLLDLAHQHLRRVLATYATLPARPARLATTTTSLSLHGREDHLDVLPTTWDIASPTLQDLAFETSPPGPLTPPDDPDVLATLLGELDDHLFALGLAPLRRVDLCAAALLGLSTADIFLLTADELAAGALPDLEQRRASHASHASLFPPSQLHDGLPVPASLTSHLRGVAIGPVAEGPLHLRRDLAELLADPPPPGAVLAIPALTAQAAVVLRALKISAVCCEHGGALSHAALMARELGISALIGCRGCTEVPPGTHVRLDTRTGRLRVRA
jgi:phosphohistidine swiveling domain-containing protein